MTVATSIVLLATAIWRLFARRVGEVSEGADAYDRTTLYFLLAAVGMLLLDRLERFKTGDYELQFREIAAEAKAASAKAKEAKEVGARAERLAMGTGGIATSGELRPSMEPRSKALGALSTFPLAKGSDPEDKQRGRFGGLAERNGRRLAATVKRLDDSDDWFDVGLTVESTPEAPPLAGAVRFFLHPTFRREEVVVPVGSKARAELNLTAFGAFTVGALADDGETSLELNLADPAQVPRAPKRFRQR